MSMKPPADFKVLLLEGEDVSLLQGKRRFANLFNLAVVSNQVSPDPEHKMQGIPRPGSFLRRVVDATRVRQCCAHNVQPRGLCDARC